MSITKRSGAYYLAFRPFGKLIYLKTNATTKGEAKALEMSILIACRSNDFRALNPDAKEACIRLFENQGMVVPADLRPQETAKEMTLWDAVQVFFKYPGIKDCPTVERYTHSLAHVVAKIGRDKPIKSLWVPDIRLYQSARLSDGASPATVNKEVGTLSKVFTVLNELQVLDSNPCRLVKRLSPGHRESYISHADFLAISGSGPSWFQAMVETAYYTGMRRGELLSLSRKQVNLDSRIIRLGELDTKEGRSKRIPIHLDLIPTLEQSMRVASLGHDNVFLVSDHNGTRPPALYSVKNPWVRHISKLRLEPEPTFHDLRHTWKTNARRSGMDPEIRESILGHWSKEKSVTERYGRISDEELRRAIDLMTFDHGETEIWAVR